MKEHATRFTSRRIALHPVEAPFDRPALLVAVVLIALSFAARADQAQTPMASDSTTSQTPSLFEVDETAAIQALERSLIQINALLLQPGQIEIGFGFNVGSSWQSSPLFLQDSEDDTLFAGTSEWRTETADVQLNLQIGLPLDMELDLSLPVSSVRSMTTVHSEGVLLDEHEDTSTGTGDLNLVLLRTLAREQRYRPDLIAFLAIDADTAQSTRPFLGSGTTETTIGINATRRQDPLTFTASLDHTFATRTKNIKSGAVTRLTLGALLTASADTALKFQIVEAHRQTSSIDGRDLSAGTRVDTMLELGISSVLSRSVSLSGSVSTGISGSDNLHVFSLTISKRLDPLTLLSAGRSL